MYNAVHYMHIYETKKQGKAANYMHISTCTYLLSLYVYVHTKSPKSIETIIWYGFLYENIVFEFALHVK